MWQKVKTGSKAGFDKAYATIDKLGPPLNRFSNKLGSEAFWPTTLDLESDKCARILKSFCKDGFYAEEEFQPVDGPKAKQRVIQKIPEKVIREAKALAIFTTMRTGFWISGTGGSGVLIARKDDGTWSPPSGIMTQSLGIGFLAGVDIYDCVMVINTQRALDAFTAVRCTLGSDISAVAGPVGAGAMLETTVHKNQAPVYTYIKSRGFYAGVQIEGTVVIERSDENERFYLQKLPVAEILAGKVRHPPYEIRRLLETIKAAQGDTDVDESLIPTEAPPSYYEIDDGKKEETFGVPKIDDPDPYGVLALEKEGMTLKEAGTQKRASWEQFSFNPSPSSPIYSVYRQSQDLGGRSASRRNSWRSSAVSAEAKMPGSLRNSLERRSSSVRSLVVMTDTSTQTDLLPDGPVSPSRRSISGHSQHSGKGSVSNAPATFMQDVPEHEVLKTPPEQHDPMSIATTNGYSTPPHTPPGKLNILEDSPEFDEDEFDDVQIIDQPVLHTIQTVQTAQPKSTQALSKARLVSVPKRVPPKLPPRNPGRNGPIVVDASPVSRTPSPTKSATSSASHPESTEEAKPVEAGLTMSSVESTDSKVAVPGEGGPKAESTATGTTDAKLEEVNLVEDDPMSTQVNGLTAESIGTGTADAKFEDVNLVEDGPLSTPLDVKEEKQKMPGGFD